MQYNKTFRTGKLLFFNLINDSLHALHFFKLFVKKLNLLVTK